MAPVARAEAAADDALQSAGIDRLQALLDGEDGFDATAFARRLLSGESPLDAQTLRDAGGRLLADFRREGAAFATRFAAPVLMCALLRLVLGRRAAGAPGLLYALCCARALAGVFAASMDVARGLMDAMSGAVNLMAPVLASAMALGGRVSGAAIVTPMAALCVNFIEDMLGGWGLKLCAIAAAVAAAGGMSERFSLDRLFSLVRGAQSWLLKLCMLAFAAAVSVQSAMSAAKDSAALSAARSAIEGMIPIIGGELSDTAGGLAVSAGAVRGALGITGIAVMLHLCAGPLLRLVVSTLTLKAAAAVAEPAADARVTAMLGRFGDALEMLLAACAACAVLSALLAGSCLLSVGNLIG